MLPATYSTKSATQEHVAPPRHLDAYTGGLLAKLGSRGGAERRPRASLSSQAQMRVTSRSRQAAAMPPCHSCAAGSQSVLRLAKAPLSRAAASASTPAVLMRGFSRRPSVSTAPRAVRPQRARACTPASPMRLAPRPSLARRGSSPASNSLVREITPSSEMSFPKSQRRCRAGSTRPGFAESASARAWMEPSPRPLCARPRVRRRGTRASEATIGRRPSSPR
mmetsp:Transcript_12019/g.35182  ORF Transcript_12019/g.35182 Transcript_12019/m.35182 type:complete len:222 (-) Transcript_12019:259-924(-)